MKLYLLSGLGADSRVFDFLELPGIEKYPVNWIPPEENESLTDYAKRLLDQIQAEEPVNLLGVSFGGIIAQEIAQFLNVRKLILVSSVKSPREIGIGFKIVKSLRIWKILGPRQLKDGMLKMGPRFFGLTSSWEKDLLHQITLDTDQKFLQWAVRQIHSWKGSYSKNEITHIHGTDDKLFPVGRIKNYIPVKDGGHFIIVNRAKEVSQLILNALK